MANKMMKMKCVICAKPIDGYGCNALPVARGQCCSRCDDLVVLPARLAALTGKQPADFFEWADRIHAATKHFKKKNNDDMKKTKPKPQTDKPIDDIAISQMTFFGGEERVANSDAIARSAVRDLAKFDLPRPEFLRRVQWLMWIRYPGSNENIMRLSQLMNGKTSDVDAVMQLDIAADFPSFDTLSRAVRKHSPAKAPRWE
jgi:hypothetical protein